MLTTESGHVMMGLTSQVINNYLTLRVLMKAQITVGVSVVSEHLHTCVMTGR